MSALPTHMTSGLTPAASAANSVPVRPKPVAISSKTSTQVVPVGHLAHDRQAGRRVDVHPPGALQQRLDDDPGQLVGVLGREPARTTPPTRRHRASVAGGRSAKTCSGRTSLNIECIPPTGSHTLMQPKVSPW